MNIKTTTILVVIISFICCTTIKSQQIKEYYITCLESDFNHIYENYQKEIYIPISITYNGETISNARMRIRGDGSIVLPKKSLKVKLDNGNFDGVSVFNFNADYEDKSYVQSYITSRLMKESGTKCFNAEHVRLYLNDEYLGLYISVQNMDIYFLLNNEFNPLGNLYKATIDGASLSRYDNVFYHWEQKTG
ncbi:MAG: CotH kinase family protein, partial [Bacteroidales bacterium]|nr:CotH kinase family protein [Bacteroidales bacterium]